MGKSGVYSGYKGGDREVCVYKGGAQEVYIQDRKDINTNKYWEAGGGCLEQAMGSSLWVW